MSCNLSGIGVLVTRPSGQAQSLCELISGNGGTPVPFPALSINGPLDPDGAEDRLSEISQYDLLIFISPNAVRATLSLLDGRPLSKDSRIAVVGKGTARALREFGIFADLLPEGRFDSESLLAMPQLQHMADRRVLILRGNGGRPLLGDTLMLRGAQVKYAEVYSRSITDVDASTLLEDWPKQVQIVTATSCEILENLFTLLGERGNSYLANTPIVVVSDRIADRARELGCCNVVLAPEASDEGILKAVCGWKAATLK